MWNFIRRALGAALLASAAAGATAQPLTIKLGWATSDGATDPLAVTARSFKQAVEKRSSGGIQVQLYPNRQLGDEKQVVEGLRFGTVDAAVITNAVTAQVEPAFGVIDLPFVFESQAHAWKVLDGAVGADLGQRAAARTWAASRCA
jgi:TRAP-type C4-dicarboxylate transport system substrate-binding protein